jgi:hypothetical protein
VSRPLTEEEIEQESLKRLVDYASFFQGSIEGRRILRYLKEALDGNYYRPGVDAMELAYRAGRRSVYLDIVSHVGEGEEEMARETKVEPQQEAMMQVALEDL